MHEFDSRERRGKGLNVYEYRMKVETENIYYQGRSETKREQKQADKVTGKN